MVSCGGKLTLAFLDAGVLALGNDLVRPGVGLVEYARRLLTRFADDLLCLCLGGLEGLLAFIGGSETFLDLLLALFERREDRWPDELHAEPDKHDHRDRLADESQIDVHIILLAKREPAMLG